MKLKKIIPIKAFQPKEVTAKFPVSTKGCSLLDQFEEQENLGKETKQQTSENARVQTMKGKFTEYLFVGYKSDYGIALDLVKNLTYSSKDVRLFSLSLAPFQDEKDFSFKDVV